MKEATEAAMKFPKEIYVTIEDDLIDPIQDENLIAWAHKDGLVGYGGQRCGIYRLLKVKTVKEIEPELV